MHIYIYIFIHMDVSLNGCNSCWVPPFYTSNLFVLYFWASTLQNRVFSNQHRGHLGSMYILNIYIYIYRCKIHPQVFPRSFRGHEPGWSCVEGWGGNPEISPFFKGRDHGFWEKKQGGQKKGPQSKLGCCFSLFFLNGTCTPGEKWRRNHKSARMLEIW